MSADPPSDLVGIAGGSDEPMRARFVREAQALAKLKHPNVLTIHDVGVEGDRVYIAMEYVEAGTLSTWCVEHQPGSRARFVEVLRFAVAAGQGLAAAHDAGVVHRDVKPANTLVGSDGRPRLADFGLARADEAVEDAKRAVKIADEVDRNSIELADARQHLARALWAVGEDRERARDLMAQALEAYRAAGKRFAPDVAETERWLTEHRL